MKCFVKQMGSTPMVANDALGEWPGDGAGGELIPASYEPQHQGELVQIKLRDNHGGEPDEWPEQLRVREWPTT